MNNNRKILIIDDEPINLAMLTEFILSYSQFFSIYKADNGQKGFEIANNEIPDLIITDWDMPILNGLELIKKLKQNPVTKEIPIIVCTGIIFGDESMVQALEAGANDFIKKPVKKFVLRARINTILKFTDALKEISKREEKYRLITENTSDVIWILNLSHNKFTYISPSIFILSGYTVEEVENKTIDETLNIESAKIIRKSINEFLPEFKKNPHKYSHIIHHHELQQRCKNGNTIWIETSSRYQLNINNEVEIIGISRNIDERKKAQENENKIKNQFKAILDNTTAVIFLKNIDLNYILVNKTFERIFGLKEKEITGKNDYAIFPKEIAERIRKTDTEIISNHKNITNEDSIEINGKQHYYLTTKFLLYNKESQPYAICGISTDITELKIREKQLKDSEEKFNSIVSNANEAIFITQDGVFKYLNQYAANLIGYSIDELLGKSFLEYTYPDDIEMLVNNYQKRIDNIEFNAKYIYRFIDSKKQVRWAEINSILHTWENQPAVLSFLTDITQRIKQEQKIKENKEKIDNIIQNASQGIVIVQNRLIVYINPYTKKLVGLEENEILNKYLIDFIYEEDKENVIQYYSNKINHIECENNLTARFINSKKEIRWAIINSTSIVWEEEVALLVFFSDISEQKIAEQKIIQQSEELRLQTEKLIALNNELSEKNEIINKKHSEIKEYSETLKTTIEYIGNQNQILVRANKEIKSSLNYARRIQQALLPTQEYIDNLFPDNFIYYQPKEIVSGDFYYVRKIKNLIIFAVADCTGHGVPGALLTMLGINFINQIILRSDINSPSQVLENLRTSFRQTFEHSEQKDGMDIILCEYNKNSKKLRFAGAYRPLVLIRDGQFFECKGVNSPVGSYINTFEYITEEIQLKKNDIIYLYTDGFSDQFCDGMIRKFSHVRFKEMLLNNHHLPMLEQKKLFVSIFENWKGHNVQTDDVLVLGIKI